MRPAPGCVAARGMRSVGAPVTREELAAATARKIRRRLLRKGRDGRALMLPVWIWPDRTKEADAVIARLVLEALESR